MEAEVSAGWIGLIGASGGAGGAVLRERTRWAPAGQEVAAEQLALDWHAPAPGDAPVTGRLTVTETATEVTVSGPEVRVRHTLDAPAGLPDLQTGNQTDVRRLSLTDRSGEGLTVVADSAEGEPLLETSALHFTPSDLDGPRHSYQLRRRDETILLVNHRQMGVGGINSWGAAPLEKYLLHSGRTYSYAYPLRPASA